MHGARVACFTVLTNNDFTFQEEIGTQLVLTAMGNFCL